MLENVTIYKCNFAFFNEKIVVIVFEIIVYALQFYVYLWIDIVTRFILDFFTVTV